jgi:hypothetical protein
MRVLRGLGVSGFAWLVAGLVVAGLVVAGCGVGAVPASAQPVGNPGGIGAPGLAAVGDGSFGDPMDVFETQTDHRVVRWSIEPDAIIRQVDLGGYSTDGVGAVRDGAGGEVVVVRGRDGAVWYQETTGNNGWTGWQSLGGRIVGHPAVAADPAGLGTGLVVVARGADGALFEQARTGSTWNLQWTRVGGRLASSASIAELDNSYLVYALGTDHRMRRTTRTLGASRTWSPWQTITWRDTPTHIIQPGYEPGINAHARQVSITDTTGQRYLGSLDGSSASGGGTGQFISPTFTLTSTSTPRSDFVPGWRSVGRGRNGLLYYNVFLATSSTGGTDFATGWIPLGSR